MTAGHLTAGTPEGLASLKQVETADTKPWRLPKRLASMKQGIRSVGGVILEPVEDRGSQVCPVIENQLVQVMGLVPG